MKTRTLYLLLSLLCPWYGIGQIAQYNHFPTRQPTHILDEKLEDISFAYSLRLLESDYDGPLIRLRRASDNQEMDFTCADDDRVDIAAIDIWRAGSLVYVTIWYDQSGIGLNAIQTNTAFQPQFMPDPTQPYFVGDGTNDLLIVPESQLNLTENGKNGTILGVFLATDRADSAFGTASGTNRWLVHINWDNERTYFDPGYCCNNPRSFINNLPTAPNPGSLGIWDQYSFIRRNDPATMVTDRIIMRLGNTEKVNGGFPDNQACTLNANFGICAVINNAANNGSGYSNTQFAEMIMYKEGKEDPFIDEIEKNQIAFWNL